LIRWRLFFRTDDAEQLIEMMARLLQMIAGFISTQDDTVLRSAAEFVFNVPKGFQNLRNGLSDGAGHFVLVGALRKKQRTPRVVGSEPSKHPNGQRAATLSCPPNHLMKKTQMPDGRGAC
jgi:hypothetical protein